MALDATTPPDLSAYMSSKVASTATEMKEAAAASIRMDAIQETAASVGARAGLVHRSRQINADILALGEARLDRMFDFSAMMLPDNVIPPVLTEGKGAYAQNSETEIRTAGRMFKIEEQARFSPVPPTWRDYLLQREEAVDTPHSSLLPKTPEERALWDNWVAKGWKHGVEQADSVFSAGLSKLKRDFKGMILYRILLAQGLVSAPQVANSNLGITGGGRQMSIDDRIYKITVPSNLISDSKQWKNWPVE